MCLPGRLRPPGASLRALPVNDFSGGALFSQPVACATPTRSDKRTDEPVAIYVIDGNPSADLPNIAAARSCAATSDAPCGPGRTVGDRRDFDVDLD